MEHIEIKKNPKFQISILKFGRWPQLFVNTKKIPKNTKEKPKIFIFNLLALRQGFKKK